MDWIARRAPDICTRERTNTFDKFRSAGIQRDCLSPSAKEINKLTDRWRAREKSRETRVTGRGTAGETTTGIRPWTTNSLINQIPVCRTNGRANIEQPVSGTPRGIKVQGISEKRFFFGGAGFSPACRRNDFRRAAAGAALWREICTLQRVARRNYSLIIRAYRARERISSLPRVNTRAAALEFTVRRDDGGGNDAWCIIHRVASVAYNIMRYASDIFISFPRMCSTEITFTPRDIAWPFRYR